MPDTFHSFKELSRARPKHYTIDFRDVGGKMLIFTPHGGGIEPGTSELCRWFSRQSYAFYCFEGIKSPCKELHITSTRFDEPQLLALLSDYTYALSFHGMANSVKRMLNGADVYLGGLNHHLVEIMQDQLEKSGFSVATAKKFQILSLAASSKRNVSNKCVSQLGLQIEISASLRKQFFGGSIRPIARRKCRSGLFYVFCKTINRVLVMFLTSAVKNRTSK